MREEGSPEPLPVRPAGAAGGPQPVIPWAELEASSEFGNLMIAKRRFLIPAVIFFLIYYFALPLGNGLAPELMKTRVIGHINLAYLFALSEFVMAWVLAYVYISRAERVFDKLSAAVGRHVRGEGQ